MISVNRSLHQKMSQQHSDRPLYCLVNNEGHTLKCPKYTLNLLTYEQHIDAQKNGLYRRRTTSPNKVDARNNVPADLYIYQAYSK